MASISCSNIALDGGANRPKSIVTNCYAKEGSCNNIFGFNDSSSLESCGTFDVSGNQTAVSGSTLCYGNDLKTAMANYIKRCGPDSDKYVTWTNDNIPSLTTTHGTPFDYDYGNFELGSDGRYFRKDSISGHIDYASITLKDGDNVTPFSDIEEAIKEAQKTDGGVLTLLSDIASKNSIKIESGKFTIDIGENHWEVACQNTDDPCISITGGEITFKGKDGQIVGESKSPIITINNSSVNFEGGNYINNDKGSVVVTEMIDDSHSVKISDGDFENTEDENACMLFKDCKNVSLSGGEFSSVKVSNDTQNNCITTIAGLLANGFAFYNHGALLTDVNRTDTGYVEVSDVAFRISSQPQSIKIKYGDSATLSTSLYMKQGYYESDVSYQWYKGGNSIEGANKYTLEENNLSVGEHEFYCIISCKGYEKKTETAKITVSKLDTSIKNKDYATEYTYNGSSIAEPTADNFESNRSNLTFTWFKGDSTAESDELKTAPKEVGNYTLKVSAEENDNYLEGYKTFPVKISYLETDSVAKLGGVKNSEGWYKSVNVNAPVDFKIATSQNSSDWQNYIYIDYSMNKDFSYYLREDSTGYITDKKTIAIKNDKTAPTIGTITYSEHQTFLDWIFNKHSIEISVPVSDDCSGTDGQHLYYNYFCNGSVCSSGTDILDGIATFAISSDFVGNVNIIAYDNAGNVSTATTTKMAVEGNAPTISILDGTNEFSETTPYNCDKSLNISVADTESGIQSVSYSIDDGKITTLFDTTSETELKNSFLDNSINLQEGTHTYTVMAVDNALNQSTKKLTITKDTTPPTLTNIGSYNGTDTTVGYNFGSDEIGIYYYVLQKASQLDLSANDVINNCHTPKILSTSNNQGTFSNLSPNTTYDFYIVLKDNAGNVSNTFKYTLVTDRTAIDNATMLFDNSDLTYNGNEQKPDTTLKIGDRTLTLGTDYTISYSNSNGGDNNLTNAGTVSVTVSGINDCKGSLTKTYEIKKAELTPTISGTTSKVYDGTQDVSDGLSIELSGIINDDTVNATADFTLDNKNVGGNKTVTANNIKIDNNNYTLKTTTATAKCGEVTARPVKVTKSGDTVYTYNGLANFNNSISYETVGGDKVNGEVLYNGSEIKPTAVGNYQLTAKINDPNYKLSEIKGVIGLIIEKANVALDISTNNQNPSYGDSEILTATVDKDNLFNTAVADLSGKVEFYLDGELLGEKDVDNFNKSASITLDKNKLTAGDHEIYAKYIGNDNINQSKSSEISTKVSKRTLNYDTSKLSVATKKYDGTTTATINGTLLVSNALDGDDVGFSYSGLNGKFKSEKAGAEDVELNIIGAKLTNNNYQLPESVPSIKGIIKIVTTINNVPESTNDEKYQIEAEYGFSEIPKTLKSNPNLNTEEKIKALMKLTVQKSMSDVNKDNISIFDLTLRMTKDGGKTWQIVDDKNFPKEGITVNLPYPEGTNKDDFDFLVTHMFTKEGIAGTTENIIPTKTDNGLEFKLYSLSPVAVGFKKIVKENPVTSETNNNQAEVTDKQTKKPNTTENKASGTKQSNPKTGACGGILPIALVTILFGSSYCALRKKKKNK